MMCSLYDSLSEILYKCMCTCTYSPCICPMYIHMYACTYVQYTGIAHSINTFSPSVEMSSLLAEICSRQEAWMEMRTGTFVDPPQDTGTTGPHPVAQEQM